MKRTVWSFFLYFCGTVVTIAAYVGVFFSVRKALSGIVSHESVVNDYCKHFMKNGSGLSVCHLTAGGSLSGRAEAFLIWKSDGSLSGQGALTEYKKRMGEYDKMMTTNGGNGESMQDYGKVAFEVECGLASNKKSRAKSPE